MSLRSIACGRLSLLFLSLTLLGLSGCGRTEVAPHPFQQYVQDGVAIAANTGGPKFDGPLFRCEQAYVLREEPDRPESLLYKAGGIRRDADGRCYVLDVGNRRIAVFDPDGRFERAIGRQGEGPGEFSSSLLFLSGLEGDVLIVWDAGARRVNRFRTDGTFLDLARSPIAGQEVYYRSQDGLFIAVRIYGTLENDELQWGQEFIARRSDGETAGSARTPLVLVKYFVPWPGMTRNDGGLEYLPFIREPSMAYAGDAGMVSTVGTEPIVEVHDFEGTLRKRILVELPEAAVIPEDVAAFLDDFDHRTDGLDTGEERYREKQRTLMRFPERRTVWNDIRVDDRGWFWLEVYEEAYERAGRGGGVLFDVLGPEGEYLGRTELPASGEIGQGHLLGIVTDPESGAETCTVWRLVPLPKGLDYR
jgi:hypothetical protein